MKNLIVSALMALSCGVLFAADTEDMYLYWMIGDNATFTDKDGQDVEVNLAEYSARISYGASGESGKYLDLYEAVDGQRKESFQADYVQSWDMLAGVGGFENNSFFIELYNASGVAYESESMSYGQLGAYISSMKGQARPADTYGFSNFKAVPEPTSGLLLLLGVAGLALRRKNKKA